MSYNQLRANIRNYMVPMTVAEAQEFIASLTDVDSTKWAEEFLTELEADFNGCETQ